jgi:hypothetical protein
MELKRILSQVGCHSPDDAVDGSTKSIRRRVTERLEGPAPGDEEADTWAD